MSDYTAILAAAVALAGAIALLDVVLLNPRRPVGPDGVRAQAPWLVTQARSLWPILLAVLLFRSFVYEPFRIPSESMLPGLIDGDFILVSKFSYGLRLPLTDTLILPTGEPRRGDVIVFRSPSEPDVDSEDSRFPDVGFVPRANLIGHAVRIWMSWQIPGRAAVAPHRPAHSVGRARRISFESWRAREEGVL